MFWNYGAPWRLGKYDFRSQKKDGYYAKFEQFLGDYKDFSKFPGGFSDAATRNEVIKRLAELHSAGEIFFRFW